MPRAIGDMFDDFLEDETGASMHFGGCFVISRRYLQVD